MEMVPNKKKYFVLERFQNSVNVSAPFVLSYTVQIILYMERWAAIATKANNNQIICDALVEECWPILIRMLDTKTLIIRYGYAVLLSLTAYYFLSKNNQCEYMHNVNLHVLMHIQYMYYGSH